jgi:hypothetical protein
MNAAADTCLFFDEHVRLNIQLPISRPDWGSEGASAEAAPVAVVTVASEIKIEAEVRLHTTESFGFLSLPVRSRVVGGMLHWVDLGLMDVWVLASMLVRNLQPAAEEPKSRGRSKSAKKTPTKSPSRVASKSPARRSRKSPARAKTSAKSPARAASKSPARRSRSKSPARAKTSTKSSARM